MKFCYNHSKQKNLPGLPFASMGRLKKMSSCGKLAQPLAWSLPLISILASAPAALAQVDTTLDWNVVDFPTTGATQGTYTNVEGSGVDVQITIVGADTSTQANPDNNLIDSDFVTPAVGTETLLVPIAGAAGTQADVTIEFFETGTTNPIAVPLAEFQLFDVDVLFNNSGQVSWQDQIEVSATAGGIPITGITAGGETPPEGIFNQEAIGANSVVVTGAAQGDDPSNPTQNANSPRQPGLTTPTTVGNFEEGNVQVNFPNPVDTISLVFSNGPGTDLFNRHAIAISDIQFQAPAITPTTPVIGVAKQISTGPTETTPGSGIFDITYSIVVENLGDEPLNTVQLVESFTDPTLTPPGPTFGPGNIISSSIGAITPVNGASLTANPNYNVSATGVVDPNVLAAGSTLPVGASATIPITVQVDSTQPDFPADGGDGYNNQVTASGIGANSGTPVDDLSDNGVDPDPNSNGNPEEPGEDDPTPVTFPEAPAIGVSKRVVSTTTQTDGDFEVVYETTVQNLGNVALNNVQLTEDLDDTYGEGAFTIISAPTFTARGLPNEVVLTPNAGFDADAPNGTPGDVNILIGTETLQVGENSTFQFTVEVESTLVATPGTFNNQIDAIGTSPNNITVNDASDDGLETDADPNDGNPGGGPTENDPTPVSLPPVEAPAIGVSKRVISATTQADGDFEVVYETTVENLGNVTLNDVQLTEDLDDTYGEGAFSIISPPTFTARGVANEVALTPNANFDADAPNGTPGDTNILDGAQTLQVGENSTFQFTVEVESTLITTPDTFLNQIEATGVSPNNTPVNDISDDGTETDADPNDGNPGGGPTENDPTPVVLPPTPVIGVAKQVVSTVLEPTGAFGANTARVTYSIIVANIGTVPLEQVQIEEDLNSVYGAGTFQVDSLTFDSGATTVAEDTGFDGIGGSNTTLLADTAGTATGTLAVGAASTFQLVVDVDTSNPNLTPALPGPYDNQVTATATDAAGNQTSDLSDSGTDVDSDGDGDPNEGGPGDPDNPVNDGSDNTQTRVRFSPDVRLVKRITRITRNGLEVAIPNIGAFNDQPGETDDNTLSTLSGGSLPLGLTNISEALQSGDIVEYTVYFFNAGLGTAENLALCDELQPPSILQTDSLELAQPTALSTGGTVLNFSNIGPLSPRAPLSPLDPSCISAPGTFPSGTPAGGLGVGAGGGVVVGGSASGLNIDSSQVGAFRFEIRIP